MSSDLNCIRCGRKGCDGKNEECHASVAPNTSCCALCRSNVNPRGFVSVCERPDCMCHTAHQSSQSKGDWLDEFNGRFIRDGRLHGNHLEVKDFFSKLLSEREARVRRIIDGHKEVDKETGEEKPHEDSCCNETIDDILKALAPHQTL